MTAGIGAHATTSPPLKSDVGFPPYWHKTPPSWCLEDMPCWIGTDADGRSDHASLHDWSRVVKGYYDCVIKNDATCIHLNK